MPVRFHSLLLIGNQHIFFFQPPIKYKSSSNLQPGGLNIEVQAD